MLAEPKTMLPLSAFPVVRLMDPGRPALVVASMPPSWLMTSPDKVTAPSLEMRSPLTSFTTTAPPFCVKPVLTVIAVATPFAPEGGSIKLAEVPAARMIWPFWRADRALVQHRLAEQRHIGAIAGRRDCRGDRRAALDHDPAAR